MNDYPAQYLDDRIFTFRKDMAICLTPDAEGKHAYFPALLTCLSLLDLLSCLNSGDLNPRGMDHILQFTNRYLPQPQYDDFHVTLLWLMFRHKTIHASQPYGVFDTYSRKGILRAKRRMKVTWAVTEQQAPAALELKPETGDLLPRSPWPVPHTHRYIISLPRFQSDLEDAVQGPSGYLHSLDVEPNALDCFSRCIEEIFPK